MSIVDQAAWEKDHGWNSPTYMCSVCGKPTTPADCFGVDRDNGVRRHANALPGDRVVCGSCVVYRLDANRDTDALIAERVFGWTPRGEHPIFCTPVYATGVGDGLLPCFSTNLHEALRLWDHLAEQHWQCSLVHKPFEAREDDRWVFHGCRLITPDPPNIMTQRIESFSAHAGTRELAIARGALAASSKASRI